VYAGHQVLDEVNGEWGTENHLKELADKIAKLDDKNYVDVCHLLFPATNVYKPHDKNDILKALTGQNYNGLRDISSFLIKHAANLANESDETDMADETELTEKAPPGMEKWVKANKSKFKKEYGPEKGEEVLYATAWKHHNESVEKLENKLTEEFKSFDKEECEKCHCEPCECKEDKKD
jgi:hypothetical protein